MDQQRIDVLNEANGFPVLHLPNVREVCLETLAGFFVRAAVFPQHNDSVAAIDKLIRYGSESIPL